MGWAAEKSSLCIPSPAPLPTPRLPPFTLPRAASSAPIARSDVFTTLANAAVSGRLAANDALSAAGDRALLFCLRCALSQPVSGGAVLASVAASCGERRSFFSLCRLPAFPPSLV